MIKRSECSFSKNLNLFQVFAFLYFILSCLTCLGVLSSVLSGVTSSWTHAEPCREIAERRELKTQINIKWHENFHMWHTSHMKCCMKCFKCSDQKPSKSLCYSYCVPPGVFLSSSLCAWDCKATTTHIWNAFPIKSAHLQCVLHLFPSTPRINAMCLYHVMFVSCLEEWPTQLTRTVGPLRARKFV